MQMFGFSKLKDLSSCDCTSYESCSLMEAGAAVAAAVPELKDHKSGDNAKDGICDSDQSRSIDQPVEYSFSSRYS